MKSRQVGKQTQGTRGKEKCQSSMWRLVHAQSCLTPCDPVDCSPPGSSVQGILQAGILEWVVTSPSPGDLPSSGIKPRSPASADGFVTWEAHQRLRQIHLLD